MIDLKLKKISFNHNKFRKLGDIELEIAPRITVIAGHNGIGKSTILGLIANGSQYTKDSIRSYFDKSFKADFSELFHIDLERELVEEKKDRPYIYLTYKVNLKEDIELITKVCSVSRQGEDRPRIIPRTDSIDVKEKGDFLKKAAIGDAAKMPIPTIYLGMSRMSPIGEYEPDHVVIKKVRESIHEEDQMYIAEKTKQIISTDLVEDPDIISHDFKFSKKSSKVPEYQHHSLSISLGQDSLSSIITALASFKKAKRELGDNYPGGILLIDELDAGFHPIAQTKLLALFKKEARALNLQIIITTHSLTILKNILSVPSNQKEVGKILDNVIYLMDTRLPKVMMDPTYTKIKNELFLNINRELEISPPIVKIYFEDDEALFVFKKIIDYLVTNKSVFEVFGVSFDYVSLNIGTDVLIKLFNKDKYFSNVLIVPDNDVLSKSSIRELVDNTQTLIPLPQSNKTPKNICPTLRTPEAILYLFIKDKLENISDNEDFWNSGESYTTDFVEERVLTLSDSELIEPKSREKKKKWFNDFYVQRFLVDRKIIELWAEENKDVIETFKKDLLLGIEFILGSDHS